MRVSKLAALCMPPPPLRGAGLQNMMSAHRIFVAVFRAPSCPHNASKE